VDQHGRHHSYGSHYVGIHVRGVSMGKQTTSSLFAEYAGGILGALRCAAVTTRGR
jgi:hypothetical protein